jgi:formylglycine-generating enzyme required for sulfatase activity
MKGERSWKERSMIAMLFIIGTLCVGCRESKVEPKRNPFSNSLGMKFVPIKITGGPTDGKKVLFSIWETRRIDYEAYSKDVSGVDNEWKSAAGNETLHPVVNVSWEDATAFCAWLTRKERAEGKIGPKDEYRLPSDHEWSCAVGIGSEENAGNSPKDKSRKLPGYQWGNAWPPPSGVGNFSSKRIAGYSDACERTAPVGSFRVDQNGLYDLSGNVWEWCRDWYSSEQRCRVLRGGSWHNSAEIYLRSSYRILGTPRGRLRNYGFRCVLSVG